MKRFLVLITFIILTLVACNEENTFSEAQLTDREQTLLSHASEISFVFDFQTGNEFKQMSLWVDKYEFGKLVDEKIAEMTTDIGNNGTIIFTNSPIPDNRNEMIFNISVLSNNGMSSINSVQKLNAMEQSTWGSNKMENIPLSKTATLANISFSKGHGMSSLSSDFFTDIDGHMNEIDEYNVVYVLKSKFHQ